MDLKDVYEEYLEYLKNMSDEELKELFEKAMKNSSVTTLEEVVYCRDCIHRPVYDEEEYDLIVPPYNNEHQDCACPYICQEDFYCNRMPDDDFYCKFGERKDEF